MKAVAGRAQVQPPDAQALAARQALGLLAVGVQTVDPGRQRVHVVLCEPLDVVGDEPGALQRELDARDVQWGGVGEDVALGERRPPRGRRGAGGRCRG